MSILIKGMEMPTNCLDCYFQDCGNCRLNEYKVVDKCIVEDRRDEDCPLVPVPPHGDLIDRDSLRASIGESIEECHKWADEVDKDTMMYARISQSLGTFVECSLRAKAAPTIIPAEEDMA